MSNFEKKHGSKIALKLTEPLEGDVTGYYPSFGSETVRPRGTPLASSGSAGEAFDGSTSTYWYTSTAGDQWIQIELDVPKPTLGFRWYIGSSNRPNQFILQGSYDEEHWEDLYSGNSENTTGWKEFNLVSASEPFAFYRWTITSRHSSSIYIYEIELIIPIGTERAFTVTGVEERYLGITKPDAEGHLPLIECWRAARLEGVIGRALSFDGVDDNVRVANHSSLQFGTNSFTLEAVIKIDAFGAKGSTVISKRQATESGSPQFKLSVTTNGGLILQTYYNGESNLSSAAGFIKEDNVYHIAAVRNSNGIHQLYVDGAKIAEESLTVRSVTNNQQLWIGDDNRDNYDTAYAGYMFDGLIDDVRIWNTARTQQQIADNMNRELTGNEPGLIAYWKFNEGLGATAYDSAGNNNGTIYGATWTDGIYNESGIYVHPPIFALRLPSELTVRFDLLGSSGDISVEYGCSDSSKTLPEIWIPVSDYDIVEIDNTYLWIRYVMPDVETIPAQFIANVRLGVLHSGGPLATATYAVEVVDRHPVEVYWQDDFSPPKKVWRDEFDGDMDGLEAGEYGLRLEAAPFLDDFSDPLESQNIWTIGKHGGSGTQAYADGESVLTPEQNKINSVSARANGDFTSVKVRVKLSPDAQNHARCYFNITLGSGGIVDFDDGLAAKWWHTVLASGYIMTLQTENNTTGITLSRRDGAGTQKTELGRVRSPTNWTTQYHDYEIQIHDTGVKFLVDDSAIGSYSDTTYKTGDILLAQGEYSNGAGAIAHIDSVTAEPGRHIPTASRTLSLDATELPESPRFRCEASIPDDTAIIIEYACTDGDEPDSGGWAEIEDGDLLTITDDTLWLRYTLETEDTSKTPILKAIWLDNQGENMEGVEATKAGIGLEEKGKSAVPSPIPFWNTDMYALKKDGSVTQLVNQYSNTYYSGNFKGAGGIPVKSNVLQEYVKAGLNKYRVKDSLPQDHTYIRFFIKASGYTTSVYVGNIRLYFKDGWSGTIQQAADDGYIDLVAFRYQSTSSTNYLWDNTDLFTGGDTDLKNYPSVYLYVRPLSALTHFEFYANKAFNTTYDYFAVHSTEVTRIQDHDDFSLFAGPGIYTVTLPTASIPDPAPRLRFATTIPDDTAIVAEYACVDSAETEPDTWTEVDDGDILDLNNAWLKLRFTLETEDETVTPLLHIDPPIRLEQAEQDQDRLLLHINSAQRFPNVEGPLLVSYDASKGNLRGVGGAVKSFVVPFMPAGLRKIPRPIFEEHVKATLADYSVELGDITHHIVGDGPFPSASSASEGVRGYWGEHDAEHVSAQLVDFTITLLGIDEIEP